MILRVGHDVFLVLFVVEGRYSIWVDVRHPTRPPTPLLRIAFIRDDRREASGLRRTETHALLSCRFLASHPSLGMYTALVKRIDMDLLPLFLTV